MEIIVVNDGSTDKTAEIAGEFRDIKLINLGTNQGYGAAIKSGFKEATGDLLGFLDGDGTCDPHFFGPLCAALLKFPADIITGSRMHKMSKMPIIRRIGEPVFTQSSCLY